MENEKYILFNADEKTINKIKEEGLDVSIRKSKNKKKNVFFHGDGCVKLGASYRKMMMENNDMYVDNKNKKAKDVTFKELNFDNDVVGSDETGKIETFKEIIVVAAYVKPGKEHMDALLELNVYDSKTIADDDYYTIDGLVEIGKKLSNIGKVTPTDKPYSDLKKKLGEENGAWVKETEHLVFCVTALSNTEYHQSKDKEDSNTQLTNLHEKVIEKLFKHIKGNNKTYIVVDDFFSEKVDNEDGNRMRLVNELKKDLDLGYSQIVSVTKADEDVIAVSCASVISAYLQYLHLNELADDYGLDYKDIFMGTISKEIYDDVKNGKFCPKEEYSSRPKEKYDKDVYDFMKKLMDKGEDVLAEFFNKNAKVYKKKK